MSGPWRTLAEKVEVRGRGQRAVTAADQLEPLGLCSSATGIDGSDRGTAEDYAAD